MFNVVPESIMPGYPWLETTPADASAIRKKLVLEIAGKMPKEQRAAAPVKKRRAVRTSAHSTTRRLAARGRKSPPCNAGELRRRNWYEDSY